MNKLDKILIRQRFMRSVATYSAQAVVQKEMAENLISQLRKNAGDDFAKILEVGCGGGLLTEQIADQLNYDEIILNDLVEDHAHLADKIADSSFICGDIEAASSLGGPFNLIASNATFQWLEDLSALLEKLADELATNGILAFTTFGPKNLREVRETTGSGLDYLTFEQISNAVAANFKILDAAETHTQLTLENPHAVLRHLQRTGVTGISRQAWTKAKLYDFIEKYQQLFAADSGVTLTYHPITIIATK